MSISIGLFKIWFIYGYIRSSIIMYASETYTHVHKHPLNNCIIKKKSEWSCSVNRSVCIQRDHVCLNIAHVGDVPCLHFAPLRYSRLIATTRVDFSSKRNVLFSTDVLWNICREREWEWEREREGERESEIKREWDRRTERERDK